MPCCCGNNEPIRTSSARVLADSRHTLCRMMPGTPWMLVRGEGALLCKRLLTSEDCLRRSAGDIRSKTASPPPPPPLPLLLPPPGGGEGVDGAANETDKAPATETHLSAVDSAAAAAAAAAAVAVAVPAAGHLFTVDDSEATSSAVRVERWVRYTAPSRPPL